MARNNRGSEDEDNIVVSPETLVSRAQTLARATRREEDDSGGDPYLVFDVGGAKYCLPISDLAGVVSLTSLTSMPGSPDIADRVFSLRGTIYTAVRLERLLGSESGEEADKAILLKGYGIALLCRRHYGIVYIPAEKIQTEGSGGDFVRGISADRIMLLDSARLIAEVKLRFGY